MGGDAKRSLQALFLPWESWQQREKASLRRALLAQGNVGKKERKARAGSSERAGGAGCGRGTRGESVVPLEKDAQLGTLSRGQAAGSTGEAAVHGQGGGVRLAPVSLPCGASTSSASPGDVQPERGLASTPSSSLCPWWPQIQGSPRSCELAPQETPQHPKALQARGFLSSALAIPPTRDPLQRAGGSLRA